MFVNTCFIINNIYIGIHANFKMFSEFNDAHFIGLFTCCSFLCFKSWSPIIDSLIHLFQIELKEGMLVMAKWVEKKRKYLGWRPSSLKYWLTVRFFLKYRLHHLWLCLNHSYCLLQPLTDHFKLTSFKRVIDDCCMNAIKNQIGNNGMSNVMLKCFQIAYIQKPVLVQLCQG